MLVRSRQQFGTEAERRYRSLIKTALRDLAAEPTRIGVKAVPGHAGTMSYPLSMSRSHAGSASDKVRLPRHVAYFRLLDADTLLLIRLRHDSMDIDRHVPSNDKP